MPSKSASTSRSAVKTTKRKSRSIAEAVLEAGSRKEKTTSFRRYDRKSLLSMGCPVLNLQFSGRIDGALPKGHMIRIYGESSSGKSLQCCHILAEASIDKNYKDYRLVYMDEEGGAQFDLSMFGPAFERRVEWESSESIEECYMKIASIFEAGPAIVIVDSLDALSSKAERKKFKTLRSASASGKEDDVKGEMTDGKAKAHSRYLRQILSGMMKHGSILIFISQVRDDFRSMIPGAKTVSGGKAVKFYAAIEWSIEKKFSISKGILAKKRDIGIVSRIRVIKNRMNGTVGDVLVPFLLKSGMDSTGACVDWLIEEKVWDAKSKDTGDSGDYKKGGLKESGITPHGLYTGSKKGKPMTRESIIQDLESNSVLMDRMLRIMEERWKEIQAAIQGASKRKNRYVTQEAGAESEAE